MIVDRAISTCESVVFAELDDEAVLLNVETGVYFGLDAVGKQIWTLLRDGCSSHELVRRLCAEYGVDAIQVSADVSEFLALLRAQGLVQQLDA